MEKSIDIETIALKLESQENRITVLEHLIFDSKDVLTLEEAAAYLGISKSTLYKLTHQHEIPFYRPNGKLIYFEKAELVAWMRKNRSMSEEEIKETAARHLSELAKSRSHEQQRNDPTGVQGQAGTGCQSCRCLRQDRQGLLSNA